MIEFRKGWNNILTKIIVLVWAMYTTIVFTTNLTDLKYEFDLFETSFRSGNFEFLQMIMDSSEGVVMFVFIFGIVWQGVTAYFFWNAIVNRRKEDIMTAFSLLITFFGAFIVMTEFFLAYNVAPVYIRLFIALLVSVVTINVIED